MSRLAGSRRIAARVLVLLAASLLACGGGKKQGPLPERPVAPLLAPLPALVNGPAVTVRGHAPLDAEVVVRGGTREVRGRTAPGGILFGLEVPLAEGANDLEVRAVVSGVESDPASATVRRVPPALALASARPAAVTAGSIVTFVGSGFGDDPAALTVVFADGAREVSAPVVTAADAELRAVVPFEFLDSAGTLGAYLHTARDTSATVTFAVTPALDATPDVKGDQTASRLDTLRRLAGVLEGLFDPARTRLSPDGAAAVLENIARIRQFADAAQAQWLPGLGEDVRAQLDRVFSSEVFGEVERLAAALATPGPSPFRCGAARGGAAAADDVPGAGEAAAKCEIFQVRAILTEINSWLIPLAALLAAADTVCAFVCPFAVPVLSWAFKAVTGLIVFVDFMIEMLEVDNPTQVTRWRIQVQTALPGGAPDVVFTGTSNVAGLVTDFTAGGLRSAFSGITLGLGPAVCGLLGIDLPAPKTYERVPILAVAEPQYGDPPDPVRAAALRVADGSKPAATHSVEGLAVPSPDAPVPVSVWVHGSCGPYSYPDRICPSPGVCSFPPCECDPPPPLWDLQVIERPIVQGFDDVAYGGWNLVGIGFSYMCGRTWTGEIMERVLWNGEVVPNECLRCLTDRIELSLELCPLLADPGRFVVEVEVAGEPRLSLPATLPMNPHVYGQVRDEARPSSAFLGDPILVSGHHFAPEPEDTLLEFQAYRGTTLHPPVGTRHPDEVHLGARSGWLSRGTDWLEVHLAEELFGQEGGQVQVVRRTDPARAIPTTWPREGEGTSTLDLRYAEGARWLDHDLAASTGAHAYARSVAVGDLDGDGAPDLVLGFPEYRIADRAVGAVYVAFGPDPGTRLPTGQRVLDLDDAGPGRTADVVILGDPNDFDPGGNGRRIGQSLAVGDADGDGIADLLVGTTDLDDDGLHQFNLNLYGFSPTHRPGKAFLLKGRPRAAWREHNGVYRVDWEVGGADVRIRGDDQRELGLAVALADLTGDGRADLVLGSPSQALTPSVPNLLPGRAWVVFGSASLPADLDVAEVLAGGIPGATFFGPGDEETPPAPAAPYHGNGLGKAVAVGDLDGDGRQDLLLGAPHSWRTLPGFASARQGAAFLFPGPIEPRVYGAFLGAGDQRLAVVGPGPEEEGGAIGWSLAVGRLAGGQRADLVLGAPAATLDYAYPVGPAADAPIRSVHLPRTGAVHVLAGDALPASGTVGVEAADLTVWGSAALPGFGAAVAVADISDGDGFWPELLVGAPGRPEPEFTLPGAVWALHGPGAWRLNGRRDVLHLTDRRFTTGDLDFADTLFRGEQVHRGWPWRGFGTAFAAAPFGRHPGSHLLVLDPLASSRDAAGALRDYSGMAYGFLAGPDAIRSHVAAEPATFGADGRADVSGTVDPGTDAAREWECAGRKPVLEITAGPAGLEAFLYEPGRMALARGTYAGPGTVAVIAGSPAPASGRCGVLFRSTSATRQTYQATVRLESLPEGWVRTWDDGVQLLGTALAGAGPRLAIAGSTQPSAGETDLWVASAGQDGAASWQRRLGQAGVAEGAVAAAVAADQGIVLLGGATQVGGVQPFAARFAADGTLAWQAGLGFRQLLSSMQVTAAPGGGAHVAITDYAQVPGPPFLLARVALYAIDGTGAVRWQAQPGATVGALAASGDRLLVAGGADTGQGWAAALAGDGSTSWQILLGPEGSGAVFRAAAPTADGGFVVAGTAVLGGQPLPWVVRLTPSGTVAWQRVLTGAGTHVEAVAEASDGAVYAAATATGGGGGPSVRAAAQEAQPAVRLLRFGTSGELRWARDLLGGSQLRGLAAGAEGGALLLVAGGVPPARLVWVSPAGALGCGPESAVAAGAFDPGFGAASGAVPFPLSAGSADALAWPVAPGAAAAQVVCSP